MDINIIIALCYLVLWIVIVPIIINIVIVLIYNHINNKKVQIFFISIFIILILIGWIVSTYFIIKYDKISL